MKLRWIRRLWLAAALAFGPMASAALAQTTIIGGPGGAAFRDDCPDRAYLVGVTPVSGKDLSGVTALCQVFVGGQAVGPPFPLQYRGQTQGNGSFTGSPFMQCPNGAAVEGMKVQVSRVNLVHQIVFVCRNPLDHIYRTSGDSGASGGAAAYERLTSCGGGAIASGLIGRYGAQIDALGLDCKVLAAAPPPVSNAGLPIKTTGRPAPPPVSNAGLPIKTTGRPSQPQPTSSIPPESTAPPVSSLAAYAGIWTVVTEQNAQYEMILRVDGAALTGSFRNLQNDMYSGTLSGHLLNDRASISWVQPNSPDSTGQPSQGTGTIRVHSDNTLGGGVTFRDPSQAQGHYYRWYGTLVRALPVAKHPANTGGR